MVMSWIVMGVWVGAAIFDWRMTRRWHRLKDETIEMQKRITSEDRQLDAEHYALAARNKSNFDNAYEALKLNMRAAAVLEKMKDGWVTASNDGKDAIREEYEVIRQEAIDFGARLMVEELEDELRDEGTTS